MERKNLLLKEEEEDEEENNEGGEELKTGWNSALGIQIDKNIYWEFL